MSKEQYGAYFGVTVNKAGYFHVFSRMRTHVYGFDIPVMTPDCKGGDELAATIDEMIRDLERLKKWGIRYGKSEKYRRNEIEAWTTDLHRAAQEQAANQE